MHFLHEKYEEPKPDFPKVIKISYIYIYITLYIYNFIYIYITLYSLVPTMEFILKI